MILDGDRIAHYLYRPYTYVWKAIHKRFGDEILNKDDKFNTAALRKIVFSNHDALDDLNKIVHPAIIHYLKDEIYHRRQSKNIVVVAALWEELKLPEICDKILCISADNKISFQRIQKRDGVPKEEYESYTSRQATCPIAAFSIENNGDFKEFYEKLNALTL